jgi:hypothetical protein
MPKTSYPIKRSATVPAFEALPELVRQLRDLIASLMQHLDVHQEDLVTITALNDTIDDVTTVLRLKHETTGTPATGIGVGMEFMEETSADNHETIARIDAVVQDATAGAEDSDIRIQLMYQGTLTERFKLSHDGQFVLRAPFPNVRFFNADANTVGEAVGQMDFYGTDSADAVQAYASIEGYVVSGTAGDEDGLILIQTVKDGTVGERIRITDDIIMPRGKGVCWVLNDSASYQVDGSTYQAYISSDNTEFRPALCLISWAGAAPQLAGAYSANGTPGSHTVVSNGDLLLQILATGSDGSDFEAAAAIEARVDGSPGNNDMPGRIALLATPDGTTTPREGLRVDGTTTATNTALMIYDVDNATLERVTVGSANSGGSGFKVLRIPN